MEEVRVALEAAARARPEPEPEVGAVVKPVKGGVKTEIDWTAVHKEMREKVGAARADRAQAREGQGEGQEGGTGRRQRASATCNSTATAMITTIIATTYHPPPTHHYRHLPSHPPTGPGGVLKSIA